MEDKMLEEFKSELIKALMKQELREGQNGELDFGETEEKQVELKKEPTAISMRIFKEDEEYETQVMNECEAFLEKHGLYPNAIVMSPITIDRWQARIEDSAAETMADDLFEDLTFDQILNSQEEELCGIGPGEDGQSTVFSTPKYELFVLQNEEYQDGVYQLFNGYSPALENGKFTFPVIDMETTGKKIRKLMDEKGISPTEVQSVCGLGSIQAVYKWFSGKSVPSIDNLGILSNLLNTPIDDLVVFKNRKD